MNGQNTRPTSLNAGPLRALLLQPTADLTRVLLGSLHRRRLALADRLWAFEAACREES